MSNEQKLEIKIKNVYYEYFSDYLVFSEQYPNLLEKGNMDEAIRYGYLCWLAEQVDQIHTENIYPKRIIENFLDLVYQTWYRAQNVLDDNQKRSQGKLVTTMIACLEEVLQSEDCDSTEIYLDEYDKRYSTAKDFYQMHMIKVAQLEYDIQEDFVYYGAVIGDTKTAEEISQFENLYPFLRKMMKDIPEILEHPIVSKKLIQAISLRKDAEKEKWLHLCKDKTKYVAKFEYATSSLECLYQCYYLKNFVLQDGDESILEATPKEHFFTESFIENFAQTLEFYAQSKQICDQEVKAYYRLCQHLRKYNQKYNETYQKPFLDLINQFITFLNTCPKEDSNNAMYTEQVRTRHLGEIKWMFSGEEESQKIKKAVNDSASMCLLIVSYFMVPEEMKEEKRKQIQESNASITNAMLYIFEDYPRMFFDDTIYERAMELLRDEKNTRKIKQKIAKIRKGI